VVKRFRRFQADPFSAVFPVIADMQEIQPRRRGCRAAFGAVAGLQRGFHVNRFPFALAHQFQRSGEVADLVMQEGTRLRPDLDFLAFAQMAGHGPHIQLVQRTYRAIGLALAGPEAGKIMMPDQILRGFMHGVFIQGNFYVPCAPGIDR